MLMQIKSMPLAKWFSTDYETEFPCTRSPWLNCNAIRQRYAKWGKRRNSVKRRRAHLQEQKGSGFWSGCKTVSKHVVLDERT